MRLPRLHVNSRVLAILALGFLAAAGVFLFQARQPRVYTLRMSGGDALGRRHELAQLLAKEAAAHGLTVSVIADPEGSGSVFKKVQSGALDIGLIQGGQEAAPGVLQVAALHVEPLHLLVKKERADKGLVGLRGGRVNLSGKKSGTRRLAREVLSFVGLEQGRDFADEDRSYAQLEKLPYAELPDAVFMVSTMPSAVGEFLVRTHGYKFVALPFGSALALRDATTIPTIIPIYSYGAEPPSPAADTPTVGNRLLLIAGKKPTRKSSSVCSRFCSPLASSGRRTFQRWTKNPSLSARKCPCTPERPPT